MASSKNTRKSKYVNSMLQGNLMLRMVMYWAIYNFALVATMAGEGLVKIVPDVIDGSQSHSFGAFFAGFIDQQGSMLLAMAALCPLLIWDMLRYSHRIAGPLYRFRKALTDHLDGQPLQKVSLREGDMLLDFQDTWNEFVEYRKMKEASQTMEAVAAAQGHPVETAGADQPEHAEASNEMQAASSV